LKKLLTLMHPFAPFITEEVNELIFNDGSLMDL
jgi:valyl-tRNA synthetase